MEAGLLLDLATHRRPRCAGKVDLDAELGWAECPNPVIEGLADRTRVTACEAPYSRGFELHLQALGSHCSRVHILAVLLECLCQGFAMEARQVRGFSVMSNLSYQSEDTSAVILTLLRVSPKLVAIHIASIGLEARGGMSPLEFAQVWTKLWTDLDCLSPVLANFETSHCRTYRGARSGGRGCVFAASGRRADA